MQYSMKKIRLYLQICFVSIGFLTFPVSNTAEAQTKFQRPDTVPTYSEYRDIDECMASLERQYQFYIRATRFWQDTAVYDRRTAYKPYPDEQLALGKGCFDRFSIDSVEDQHVDTWAVYLNRTGRNDEAWNLLMRRLLAAPDSVKQKAFSAAMTSAIYTRPINVERVLELYQLGRNSIPEDSLERRYLLEFSQATLGMTILDPQITLQFLDSMIAIYAKFPERLKDRFAPLHDQTYRLASLSRRSDSVRAGVNAHLAYEHEVHSAVYGDRRSFTNFFVEAQMPEINPEYWFYKPSVGKDSNLLKKIDRPHKIPALGKVSIVSFVDGCHGEFSGLGPVARNPGPNGCIPFISVLARLQKKFPEVEFTTVTKTYGFVGASAMLTPELEADSLSKHYMNSLGLGGFFTVAEAEFIRIPGLDNRRVDDEPKYRSDLNAVDPNLGNNVTSMGLLIDTKGRIVARLFLTPQFEEDDIKLIQAVIDRKND